MRVPQLSLVFSRRASILALAAFLTAVLFGLPPAQAGLQEPQAKPAAEATIAHLNVLFVGNSYCFVNDLPGLLVDLAKSDPRGPKIEVESVTPGGATLKQHFETTEALAKIRAGGYTHVVLQGQSLEPLANPEEFQSFASKLAKEAKKHSGRVVFYQTWARQSGAKEYEQAWSGGTPGKMQDGMSAAYAKAAKACGGRVARVGDAWRAALESEDPPKLFAPDGSHPSVAGSYLAACVFYETLTDRSCLELKVERPGIDAEQAARLRRLAHALSAK